MAENQKQEQSRDNKQKFRESQDRKPIENVMESTKQKFECNYIRL